MPSWNATRSMYWCMLCNIVHTSTYCILCLGSTYLDLQLVRPKAWNKKLPKMEKTSRCCYKQFIFLLLESNEKSRHRTTWRALLMDMSFYADESVISSEPTVSGCPLCLQTIKNHSVCYYRHWAGKNL